MYKSLPGAAYGDEVGGRRVDSVPSGIYPAKEGVTVVVSAANSAARKRPRTSDQGPRAVEDQAVQAAQRPEGSGPRNSDENGSGRRAANADSEAKGLTAVELDEADLDSDAELENFDDIDADDADLEALADEDLEDTDDIGDVAEKEAADDGP